MPPAEGPKAATPACGGPGDTGGPGGPGKGPTEPRAQYRMRQTGPKPGGAWAGAGGSSGARPQRGKDFTVWPRLTDKRNRLNDFVEMKDVAIFLPGQILTSEKELR